MARELRVFVSAPPALTDDRIREVIDHVLAREPDRLRLASHAGQFGMGKTCAVADALAIIAHTDALVRRIPRSIRMDEIQSIRHLDRCVDRLFTGEPALGAWHEHCLADDIDPLTDAWPAGAGAEARIFHDRIVDVVKRLRLDALGDLLDRLPRAARDEVLGRAIESDRGIFDRLAAAIPVAARNLAPLTDLRLEQIDRLVELIDEQSLFDRIPERRRRDVLDDIIAADETLREFFERDADARCWWQGRSTTVRFEDVCPRVSGVVRRAFYDALESYHRVRMTRHIAGLLRRWPLREEWSATFYLFCTSVDAMDRRLCEEPAFKAWVSGAANRDTPPTAEELEDQLASRFEFRFLFELKCQLDRFRKRETRSSRRVPSVALFPDPVPEPETIESTLELIGVEPAEAERLHDTWKQRLTEKELEVWELRTRGLGNSLVAEVIGATSSATSQRWASALAKLDEVVEEAIGAAVEPRIGERLGHDLGVARKSRDEHRMKPIRVLVSRLKERQVDLRSERGRDHVMTEAEALDVVFRYARDLEAAAAGARQRGQSDRAALSDRELEVVRAYLPEPLSADEIRGLVDLAIRASRCETLDDAERALAVIRDDIAGSADPREVLDLIRDRLGG